MARAAMMCCEPSPPRLRPAGSQAGDRCFPDFFLSDFSAAEREVVGTGGFEPPTCRLGGDRSIHLSYVPLPLHFTSPPVNFLAGRERAVSVPLPHPPCPCQAPPGGRDGRAARTGSEVSTAAGFGIEYNRLLTHAALHPHRGCDAAYNQELSYEGNHGEDSASHSRCSRFSVHAHFHAGPAGAAESATKGRRAGAGGAVKASGGARPVSGQEFGSRRAPAGDRKKRS